MIVRRWSTALLASACLALGPALPAGAQQPQPSDSPTPSESARPGGEAPPTEDPDVGDPPPAEPSPGDGTTEPAQTVFATVTDLRIYDGTTGKTTQAALELALANLDEGDLVDLRLETALVFDQPVPAVLPAGQTIILTATRPSDPDAPGQFEDLAVRVTGIIDELPIDVQARIVSEQIEISATVIVREDEDQPVAGNDVGDEVVSAPETLPFTGTPVGPSFATALGMLAAGRRLVRRSHRTTS